MNPEQAIGAPKSQRDLVEGERDQNDINIPRSMQDIFYNRMSKHIASSIEFVNVDCPSSKRMAKKMKTVDDNQPAMKLLKGSDPIKHIAGTVALDGPIVMKQTKPSIARRQIEPNEMTDEQKVHAVAVDAESIIQGNEIRNWRPKKVRLHKIFNYREKNDRLYLVEPSTEFSARRKRNNWTESKISKWKLVK